MATYNGNNIFTSIDGYDVSALWTGDWDLQVTNALAEITAGSGQTHVQRGKGLTDATIPMDLIYDVDLVPEYIDKMTPGDEYTIITGPRTSVAGNPKHAGKFRCASVSSPVNIARNLVKFTIQWQQSDAPTSDMYNGDTF